MRILFLEYPKCSTCKRAKAWLTENGVAFDDRHIVEDNPTAEELRHGGRKADCRSKNFSIQAVWFIRSRTSRKGCPI